MSAPPPSPDLPLLAPDEPPAYGIVNDAGTAPILLLCDHARAAVPRRLGDLGVSAQDRRRHIAYDIGAAAIALDLSARLDAPLLMTGYSRLVIDCNRRPDDPTSIPPFSDGTEVPGNAGLDEAARELRVATLFRPYHVAIGATLDQFAERGMAPAIVSIHTCTPVMAGFQRPWEIGVLWNEDGRIAEPLIHALEAEGDLTVGDNQPYSGRDGHGYTLETHAEPRGLPHVLLEVRQDLVAEAAGQRAWAERLHRVMGPILRAVA